MASRGYARLAPPVMATHRSDLQLPLTSAIPKSEARVALDNVADNVRSRLTHMLGARTLKKKGSSLSLTIAPGEPQLRRDNFSPIDCSSVEPSPISPRTQDPFPEEHEDVQIVRPRESSRADWDPLPLDSEDPSLQLGEEQRQWKMTPSRFAPHLQPAYSYPPTVLSRYGAGNGDDETLYWQDLDSVLEEEWAYQMDENFEAHNDRTHIQDGDTEHLFQQPWPARVG